MTWRAARHCLCVCVLQHLKQQQEGIQHLISIVKDDLDDLSLIEQGLTSDTRLVRSWWRHASNLDTDLKHEINMLLRMPHWLIFPTVSCIHCVYMYVITWQYQSRVGAFMSQQVLVVISHYQWVHHADCKQPTIQNAQCKTSAFMSTVTSTGSDGTQ